MLNKTKSMNALIEQTLQTVHRVSAELRPGLLDDFGLTAAIEWQAEEFQERTGIKATLHLPEHAIDLSKDQSTALFRILQEALTNVIRHANASAIGVTLQETGGRLSLTVTDNGRGITAAESSHPQSFGLIGMQERVYPWKGEVRVQGIPGRGTTVTVTIPLIEKETGHD
jgi:signal transduction histidine kinase